MLPGLAGFMMLVDWIRAFLMTAKQIYLVAYDYGQGARWAYVRAASPADKSKPLCRS